MVSVHPKVAEIFEMMALEKFFCCTDSLDEALAPLKNGTAALGFRMTVQCPICDKRLRASKTGRFRCPACKTVLSVEESGSVFPERIPNPRSTAAGEN